ncbi:MAG: Acetyl-coenzyme A synthetase [Firmicutes bacterium ADurb.Bin193]|nr:MAG: Acetyl-coenzyme A synthetase [Firmicutes bacterium ADurb.Bin193]
MSLIEKYVRVDFKSYEDFVQNFSINVPDRFNFGYDVVDELAKTSPDSRALVWCNDRGEDKTFTYKEISVLSNKTANFLLSLGIKKGDRVMLILKRNYQFWYAITALHKIGAVAVPATHLLTKKDLVYRNNRADIKAVICTNDELVLSHVEAAEPESPTLKIKLSANCKRDGWIPFDEGVEAASEVFVKPADCDLPENGDIMLLYFTSGTSGNPKMVTHNFVYPLGHIITSKFWQNCQKDGLHLTIADTGWAKAVWGKLYGQWLCETAIFVYDMDKFVPDILLEKIAKYKVTSFCAPPTMYRFMLGEDFSKYDLSALKYCTIAGEPLNPEVYNKFFRFTGHKMMEGFGQTETVVTVANFPWMTPKPGSMGKPSPLYNIDIIDSEGKSCAIGDEGEIVVKIGDNPPPPGMFLGYHKDEELTNSVWHDGVYHTGDIAWKDEEGYYWYVGRNDDVIKSSGYRIGPFEVESALMEHPAVLETAITAVPDEIRGQIVKATIILAKGYSPSEELKKELQDHVKKVTAPYKYPRIIEFVDELPKTISGKIRRVQLREQDAKKSD